MKKTIGITLMLCLLVTACSGSGRNAEERPASGASETLGGDLAPNISPAKCRITGIIVSIDPEIISSDPDDPLSKAPGIAKVKVQSIIGYGSAFGSPLAANDEINVLFKFTLSPTKNLVAGLSADYPGLKAGSVFTADVERIRERPARPGGRTTPTKYQYVIYDYKVK